MEPVAKADYGTVAVLVIDVEQRFIPISEIAAAPELMHLFPGVIRKIESIVVARRGAVIGFDLPMIAVWEGKEIGARLAAGAAISIIAASVAGKKSSESATSAVRIGAGYGESLLQRDRKGRVANLLGQLLKTTAALCRKARVEKLVMVATDEFVAVAGSEGFERFEEGIQKLKVEYG
jgi:hypothetical protein